MKVRKEIAGLLLAVPLLLASSGVAVAAGVEGEDYLIPVGEEVPATNGARAWVSGCEINDAAGTFPLQTAEGDLDGHYYLCQVGFVIAEGHQPGTTYSVNASDVATTATFQSLGVPLVPSGGIECEPGALLPSFAGVVGGDGTIGFDGEIGAGEYAAGLTLGFQDATCNVARTPSPDPTKEPEPAEPVVPEPTEEPKVPTPAERYIPVIGSCGYIPLPNGLDPSALANVMTNATPIPVTSDGIKATAYVTRKSFSTDIGNGPYEQNQIDIYVIPQLPYDSQSVQGKTWWTNGEAPQLEELFKSRTYVIDLDALLATPEMVQAGATGLAFTDQAMPGFNVSIGADLKITSDLLHSFMMQSGNQDRPLVNTVVAVAPLPAECDVPVVTEPPTTTPVEDPTPEPSTKPAPALQTPRSIPKSVKTDVGPVNASVPASQELADRSALWLGSGSIAPTIRELLTMLETATIPTIPVLTLPAPRTMPFAEALEPATFKDLWVIDDPSNGYSADGPRYFLAHTHTRGGAIGNAVNEAGLTPGETIEVAGVRYDVSNVSTVAKPDIGTLPIWHSTDSDDAFLIVCLWNNGSLATHNLVIELHAEGNSGR